MLIVLFQPDDVLAMHPIWRNHDLLSLTPAAARVAVKSGLRVRTTLNVFSDCEHARCVAAARRAVREFDLAALKHDLSPSLTLIGRQTAWYVANITQRIALTVPDEPMRLRNRSGEWHDTAGRADLITHLFPRILEAGSAHRLPSRQAWLPWLYNRLTVIAARVTRGRGPWVFTPVALKLGFAKAFESAGLRVGRIELTRGTLDDYRILARAMLGRSSVLRVAPLATNSEVVVQSMRKFEAVETVYSNRFVRLGWRLYLPFLKRNLAGMLALKTNGSELLRVVGAMAVASYESNGWASPALFEAAHESGIEAVVLNHNSHALVGSPIADAVISHYCEQRKSAALATVAVHWTPSDAAIANQRAKEKNMPRQNLLCRLEYPAPSVAKNRRFRVLHAGNYQEWTDFFPWVAETSDEFVKGIAELAHAAAGIPDLDLIVRVRPKMEVNADVIRGYVPAAENVQVCSTEDEFLQQLTESDLLVSYFSTTVAQALQMKKPVLLWGSTKRFRQLPARMTMPTQHDRAAVYAVDEVARLRPMLTALRDHHRNPLDDSEIAEHRFPPTVGGAADAIRKFNRLSS